HRDTILPHHALGDIAQHRRAPFALAAKWNSLTDLGQVVPYVKTDRVGIFVFQKAARDGEGDPGLPKHRDCDIGSVAVLQAQAGCALRQKIHQWKALSHRKAADTVEGLVHLFQASKAEETLGA